MCGLGNLKNGMSKIFFKYIYSNLRNFDGSTTKQIIPRTTLNFSMSKSFHIEPTMRIQQYCGTMYIRTNAKIV